MLNNGVTSKTFFATVIILVGIFSSLLWITYDKADRAITKDEVVVLIIREIDEGNFSTKTDMADLKAEIVVVRANLNDILKLLRKERESE